MAIKCSRRKHITITWCASIGLSDYVEQSNLHIYNGCSMSEKKKTFFTEATEVLG